MRYVELVDIIFANIATLAEPQQIITMKPIVTLHATAKAWLINSVLAPHARTRC